MKKKTYSFETYTYAPEINKAFINGVAVPNYLVCAGTYEEMVRDLRSWFKQMRKGFSVTVENIGATENLPNETFEYAGNARRFLLRWLVSKKRGESDFIKSVAPDGTVEYEKRRYNFRILKVNVYSLERR